ncbi:MAG: diguanylate cyclase [Rubrivivax sp.]
MQALTQLAHPLATRLQEAGPGWMLLVLLGLTALAAGLGVAGSVLVIRLQAARRRAQPRRRRPRARATGLPAWPCAPASKRRSKKRCGKRRTTAAPRWRCCTSAWTTCAASTTASASAPATVSPGSAPSGRAARHRRGRPARPAELARLGGEEFAVRLLADEATASAVAVQVCAVLARPFEIEGQSVGVTASVGVACYPAHGAWSRLLPHAGAAMRHVRGAGGNSHAPTRRRWRWTCASRRCCCRTCAWPSSATN